MNHDVEIYEEQLQHFFPLLAEDAGSAEAMEVEQETGKPNENQEEGAEGGEPEQSSTPGGTSVTTDVEMKESTKDEDKPEKGTGTASRADDEMEGSEKPDENPEKKPKFDELEEVAKVENREEVVEPSGTVEEEENSLKEEDKSEKGTDVGNPGEVAGVAIQETVKGADKSDKSCSLGTSGTVNEEMKDLWKTDENPEKGADDGNPGEGTEVANQEGVNGADKLGTSCTVQKQIEDAGENENKPLEPPSAETQNEPRKRSGL